MFNIMHLFRVYNKMTSHYKIIFIPSNISNELINISVDYSMVAVSMTTLFLSIKLFEPKRKIHNLSESFLLTLNYWYIWFWQKRFFCLDSTEIIE